MVSELQVRVSPDVAYVESKLKKYVARELGVQESQIEGIVISKRSIDARKRRVMINLRIVV